MAFWDVLFVTQDLDVSPDEAVDDAPPAVYVGSFHDYAVLDLGIGDADVVSDACVGSNVGVWAYLAVLADYDWSTDVRAID